MSYLIAGLIVFLGVHVVPTIPNLRASLVERLGLGGFKFAFMVASFAGLALIATGYGAAQGSVGNPEIWSPPTWTRHIALLLMLPALIALVAAYVPSRIRTALKHPMLVSVKIWALAHLLANGDLASVLLFGSFLAWAVWDRISVKRRSALGPLGTQTGGLGGDVAAIGIGTAAYLFLLLYGHAWLFGVAPVPSLSA